MQHPLQISALTRHTINVLTGLLQLSLMGLFYLTIMQSSLAWEGSFLWLDTVSAPDPEFILPALASTLLMVVLVLIIPIRTHGKYVLFALGGVALFWFLHQLEAAANVYLAISMSALILQGIVFKAFGKNTSVRSSTANRKTNTIVDSGLVALSQAHYLKESTGKKAARLGELLEAGYNVPDGIVFTSEITNKSRRNPDSPLLNRRQSRTLDTLWKNLRTSTVAVRSSGASDYGAGSSFAGVYECILNVGREGLETAVKEVYQSMCSDTSAAYMQGAIEEGMVATLDQGGVVVQKMLAIEYSGVMFTEHPVTSGAMLIEMITNPGVEPINDSITPDTFTYGKLTSQLLQEKSSINVLPPMDIAPLLALGRELESRFSHPQDIEWAYEKGKFYLLQVRDIDRSVSRGKTLRHLAERERRQLLQNLLGQRKHVRRSEKLAVDEPLYVQNVLPESHPHSSPFSIDFMERLWSVGGGTDLAYRDLGIPYNVHPRSMPCITSVFGTVLFNQQEARRRLGKGPGALASFRLARNAEATRTQFLDEFLPRFQLEMEERNAMVIENMTLPALTRLLNSWVDGFIKETGFTAERINISADFHIKSALDKLTEAKLEPVQFFDVGDENVIRQLELLQQGGENLTRRYIDECLMVFGPGASFSHELLASRFNEDMNLVQQYIERSSHSTNNTIGNSILEAIDTPVPDSKGLAIAVQRARNFMRLKEEARHLCLMELTQIRRLLLAIDEKCHLDGRIFQLTFEEILLLNDPEQCESLNGIADQRFEESSASNHLRLPASLSINDLERIDMLTGARPSATAVTEHSGTLVAGEQEMVGRARVITDIQQVHAFREGEILITRMTDPSWYPLFPKAGGIVTEVGGWLSHAAMAAREHDLPAIVGFTKATQHLNTGDVIRMSLTGAVEVLEERRTSANSSSGESSASVEVASPVAENDHELHTGDNAASVNVYQLSSRTMFKYQNRIDRRLLKNSLGDRRTEPRFTASGDLQPDRRAANQASKPDIFKKTG